MPSKVSLQGSHDIEDVANIINQPVDVCFVTTLSMMQEKKNVSVE